FFLLLPVLKVRVERSCRTNCRINRGAAKICRQCPRQWKSWLSILNGFDSKLFQFGKNLFSRQLKQQLVALQDIKVEANGIIEQSRGRFYPVSMLIFKLLDYRFSCH